MTPPSAPPASESGQSMETDNNRKEEVADANDQYLSAGDSRDLVEKWIVKFLPPLQKADAENYCNILIENGFDSSEALGSVEEEDLQFMKNGHKKALVRNLSLLEKNWMFSAWPCHGGVWLV